MLETIFVGGQISQHVKAWEKITSDPWIISTVRGVELPFEQIPWQETEPRPFKLSLEESDFVCSEILRLSELEIIEEANPTRGQVISNIFLRPKKDGAFRMILDLTWLNKHVQYEHFKMSSLQTAIDMIRKNCWMGSIDLKDAYYTVLVKESHRKFLRFRWQGKLWQFRVLPNGLACAPRSFTKLLVPAFAVVRERGLECFPYIDDIFVVADSTEDCSNSIDQLRQVLEDLGFKIHEEKSEFTPTRNLTFLGYSLNSVTMRVFLTEDKEEKFLRAASDLLNRESPTIREVSGLVGLMVAFSTAFNYGTVHLKDIEREKIEALAKAAGDFDKTMTLSTLARDEILWWVDNIRSSGKLIRRGKPNLTVYTDASNERWGAHVGETATGGRWSVDEKRDHINVLELRAILLALKSLCESTQVHIRIMTDNTTALAYVAHQGGVRSKECQQVARLIWQWAEDRQNWLSIAHIPGVDNVLADFKSRHFQDNLEWALNDKLFEKIVESFGQPDVDLFASRLNRKLHNYVARYPDPDAMAIDAFCLDWSEFKCFYAFPPFSCAGLVIEKALEERATGILVVPHWPTRPWWGRLIALQLKRRTFRPRKNNLKPIGSPDNVPMLNRSPLAAFLFSPKC